MSYAEAVELPRNDFQRIIEALNAEPIEDWDFCDGQKIQPSELEGFLKSYFVRHDPEAILAGRESVPEPALILIHQNSDRFSFRVYSIADETTRLNAKKVSDSMRGGASAAQ